MIENVIKKLFPIRDEKGQPCTFPTFASQVFFDDGSVLEGKEFGSSGSIDPLTIYPVGSIYMSVNETSPASLFGGTWEQLKDRFLLGAGDSYAAGSEGGEAAHVLTVDELAQHAHGPGPSSQRNWVPNSNYGRHQVTTGTGAVYVLGIDSIDAYTWGQTYPTGSGIAHNNMPPYLSVYMWKRVS